METRAAARRRHALAPSSLLHGLLHHPEGRAVWEGRVAPLAGRLGLAALAAACRAGRDYRRERVRGGEEELLRLNTRRVYYQGLGELRAALALGLELNQYTGYFTAQYGTVEALAWLLDSSEAIEVCVKSTVWVNAACADSERVAKLEVLHQRIPGEWDGCACRLAAYYGYTDALVWLHEHGAPWNQLTCSQAADAGRLEALRYLREHGCPWDREVCLREARENEREHVVAWIEQQPAQRAPTRCNNFDVA